MSSSDTSEGTVSPASLTFTSTNWNVAQTVTVTGVNDDLPDGDIIYTVVIGPATSNDNNYNGIDPDDLTLTNLDDGDASIPTSNEWGMILTSCLLALLALTVLRRREDA